MNDVAKQIQEVHEGVRLLTGDLQPRVLKLEAKSEDAVTKKELQSFLEVVQKHGPATRVGYEEGPRDLKAAERNVGALCRGLMDGSIVAKALSEGTGSAGGYTIPTDLATDVWAIATGESTMRPLVTRLAMRTQVVNLISLTQDMALVWLAEGDSITEGEPTFGRPVLTAKKVASRFTLSNELLRDNQVDLLQLAGRRWIAKFGRETDRVIFRGDTVAHPNEPAKGLLVDAGVNVVTAGYPTFSGLQADDLLALIDAVDPLDAENGMFFVHPSILNVLRRLRGLNDQYLVELPSSGIPFQADGAIVTRLWGHRVVTVNDMPKVSDTAVSTKFVAFGDPKNIVIGDRMDIEVASSPHVLFTTDSTMVRAVARMGVALPRPAAFSVLKTAAS